MMRIMFVVLLLLIVVVVAAGGVGVYDVDADLYSGHVQTLYCLDNLPMVCWSGESVQVNEPFFEFPR